MARKLRLQYAGAIYLIRRIKPRLPNDPKLARLAERLTRSKTVNSHFQG